MIGAVIVWFLLAILYEGLKTFREYLVYVDMKHWKKHNQKASRDCSDNNGDKTFLIQSKESTVSSKGYVRV